MIFRKKTFEWTAAVLTAVFVMTLGVFNYTAFAEGDSVCKGRITGVTPSYPDTNVNGGITSFDAHPQGASNEDGTAVSLSIVKSGDGGALAPGLGDGLAPGNRGDAACLEKLSEVKRVTIGDFVDMEYEYEVKGWAWNTSGGFISFSCKDNEANPPVTVQNADEEDVLLKVNNAGGEDVPCGEIDYGVYISPDLGGGVRKLFGYAWSPAFGWIQFDNKEGDSIEYGVELDTSGNSSGYAWAQSKIYFGFSGLNLQLGDEVVPVPGDGWCAGRAGICVEVTPSPQAFIQSQEDLDAIKVADGMEGYFVHLYFRDDKGVPFDPTGNSALTGGLSVNWKDTVKTNQVSGSPVADSLALAATPWASNLGGVTFKPLKFSDFVQVNKSGKKDVGHFTSKLVTASYAPTSESKISPTTSKPDSVYYMNNEDFYFTPQGLVLPEEKNQLILKNISYPSWTDSSGKILNGGSALPNGKSNLALRFRPAVIVNTLYANDFQDTILAYRSVPMNFKVGIRVLGGLLIDPGFQDGWAFLNLAYSVEETELQSSCSSDSVKKDFTFEFLKDFNGSAPQSSNKSALVGFIEALNTSGPVDIQASAEIPDYDSNDPAQLPCAVAKGANLYTKIVYQVNNKLIQYFDNKLPRVAGDAILNPVAVVRGNVFSQAVGEISASERVQTSGKVNLNLIRDIIDENIENYSDETDLKNLTQGDCEILDLQNTEGGLYTGDCKAGSYLSFEVGNEHVLYFRGTNAILDFSGGEIIGKWVIITDGGNIFVNSNLVPSDNKDRISLVAFRSKADDDYFTTGNIYIAPCSADVTNLRATIVADGSVFSYSGDMAAINDVNGEPEWGGGYTDMVTALNCQLLFKGAIFSDNTIGGANLDQGLNPRNFLLAGGGRVVKLPASTEDRMRAQFYDLNYLRMFRLELEITPEGLPIDQSCGKAWTAQDQKDLAAGKVVCGEKKPCDPNGNENQLNICDGINPLIKYDEQNATNGDLVLPKGELKLADGLNHDTDFEPLYVYYLQPDATSFVFSKKGAVNTGGN